jgi:hypothetical protein
MACQLARYINLGGQPIRFGIGSVPGKAWDRYDSMPGEVVEGPAGYQRAFLDAGYSLSTPELEASTSTDAGQPLQVETAVADPERFLISPDGQVAPAGFTSVPDSPVPNVDDPDRFVFNGIDRGIEPEPDPAPAGVVLTREVMVESLARLAEIAPPIPTVAGEAPTPEAAKPIAGKKGRRGR